MLKIEKTEVVGLEPAIRGMRNPMNSWEKSDSLFVDNCGDYYTIWGDHGPWPDETYVDTIVGKNDRDLMLRLAKGGPVHAKYRRMIVVYADITAPLYWWKEFDTYKVGTVANSCSTMHKIQEREFTRDDFSHDHLDGGAFDMLDQVIFQLNRDRERYLQTSEKTYWWQMIQLLPSSYNQKRTIMMNYEVLAGIYPMRKDHKLDEWHTFCNWIKSLPFSELVVGVEDA